MRQCIRWLVLFATLPALGLAVAPAMAGGNRNAATWYRRAFAELDAFNRAEWDVIEAYRADPSGPPPPALRQALAKGTAAMDFVRRGAEQGYADYDLDYSLGAELQLPHLARLRNLTKLMQADVYVRLHDGDSAGASRQVAAMYRAAGHCTDDRILISSLVGNSVFQVTDQAAQIAIDRAAFGPGESALVLGAVESLDEADPFAVAEALVGEQDFLVGWMEREYGGQEQRQAMVDGDMFWLTGSGEAEREMAAMSDDEFAQSIGDYDQMMGEVVAAFANEDREAGRAELVAIYDRFEEGDHGLLAHLMTPAFLRVFDQMEASAAQVAGRRAVLEALAAGTRKPEDEANAAVDYLRAIELIREMEPERLGVLTAYAAGESGGESGGESEGESEGLRESIGVTGPIVAAARAGSEKRRCDFSYLRGRGIPGFAPAYVPGMCDLFRVLHADARRHLEAGDGAAAADRLAIAYRVVAHLGRDEVLLSAIVAHDAFQRTDALVGPALTAGILGVDERAALADAAQRIGRKDPFGYVDALAAERGHVERLVGLRVAHEAPRFEEIMDSAKHVSGEEALYVLAVRDTLEGDASAGPDLTRRLDGAISVETLAMVRAEARLLAPQYRAGEIDLYRDREVPKIADVSDRMRSARGDLRRGLARLQPERPNAAPRHPAIEPGSP